MPASFSCDLLENFYLCGIKHNLLEERKNERAVVICLKISIFVVSNTTFWKILYCFLSCDLLENFYLCGIKHNWQLVLITLPTLWFAWKFLSLWYQTQLLFPYTFPQFCCDLLENFYLCGIKHNLYNRLPAAVRLWFAWKFLSLWYQTQLYQL